MCNKQTVLAGAGGVIKRVIGFAVAIALTACSGGGGVDVAVEDDNSGLTLDFSVYQRAGGINEIFDTDLNGRTCSSAGCHNASGGAGGALKLFPQALPDSAEMMANFMSAKGLANINQPANSKLLLEPLAGTSSLTGSHAGGDIFASTSNPNYQRILQWIANPVSE